MNRPALLLAILLITGNVQSARAEYRTALGLRMNGGYGISLRHMITDKNSIEGMLHSRWRGLVLTGLYQANFPVFTEPGFRFYMGAGGHIGFWNRKYHPWWDEKKNRYEDGQAAVIGIDGQIGLEYTFANIPLNLSIDWKPAINLIGINNYWGSDAALSVRYAFK